MGVAKELMMETGPDVEIAFVCPLCRGSASSWIQEPDTDYEEGEGDTFIEQAKCWNPKCQAKWEVELYAKNGRVKYTVMNHPGIVVTVRPLSEIDEWFDEPLPEAGAYGILLGALDELRTMVGQMATPDGASTVNRMLFVHVYSIIEAYLSDVITGIAMADTNIQLKLLNHVDALKTKRLTLEDFLKQPTAVVDHIRANLAKTSFHNFDAVNKICAAIISHSVFPENAEDRAFLEASVDKRHDCVHRNGLTHGGHLHSDITPDYIMRLGKLFEDIAHSLEDRLSDLKVERFFEDLDAGAKLTSAS